MFKATLRVVMARVLFITLERKRLPDVILNSVSVLPMCTWV